MPPAGRIRIIAGTLRGSKLDVPHSAGLRPTPNRVRETLFNWLQHDIEGARCLDLFSGSGANAIEAMSRGAASAVLIERDRKLAARLRDNLARLHVEHARVVCADALAWLARAPETAAGPFDVVFMDPPFALDVATKAAQRLECGGLLATAALIGIELPAEHEVQVPSNWATHRSGRAGALGYTLYRRQSPTETRP